MKTVFVVGISDTECNSINSIHETYEGALRAWNTAREDLIKHAKRIKYYNVARGHSHNFDDSYNSYIQALSCTDPKKIANYPNDTPYITEFELQQ